MKSIERKILMSDQTDTSPLKKKKKKSGAEVIALRGEVVALDLGVSDVHTDGSSKPVWITLAVPGKFRGHPSGPFELSDEVFRQCIANWEMDGRKPIGVDYEHQSERNDLTGPTPACGWIHDLKIERGNLMALVKWLPQAAALIRQGAYRGISPAIAFGSRDRITGADRKAVLRSAGVTNTPFLDLPPITAKDEVVIDAKNAMNRHGDKRPDKQPSQPKPLSDDEPTTATDDVECTAKACLECRAALTASIAECAALTSRIAALESTPMRDTSVAVLMKLESDNTTLAAENKRLAKRVAEQDEYEIMTMVDQAISNYGDQRFAKIFNPNVTEKQRPALMKMARADRDSFSELYPPIDPKHLHLCMGPIASGIVQSRDVPQLHEHTLKLKDEANPVPSEAELYKLKRDAGIDHTTATIEAATEHTRLMTERRALNNSVGGL